MSSRKKQRAAARNENVTPPHAASHDPAPGRPRKWLILIGLFVAAFIVRVYKLGEADLWVDEILFIRLCTPPITLWQAFLVHYQQFPVIGHLPLPAVIQNAFLWLVYPTSENLWYDPFWQRFPAAVMGSISVPVLYSLTRRVFDERVAWYSALLLLFLLFPVFFSREAYYYAPLLFFFLIQLYYLVRLLPSRVPLRKDVIGLAAAGLATAYAHPSGVLGPLSVLLVVLGLVVLKNPLKRLADFSSGRTLGLALVASLVPLLGLLPFYLQRWKNPGQQGLAGAIPVHEMLADLAGKMFMGLHAPGLIAFAVFFGLGVFAATRPGSNAVMRRVLIAILMVSFTAILIGVLKTQYSNKYFYLTFGLFYMLLGAGMDAFSGMVAGSRESWTLHRVRVGGALLGAFVLIHLFFYLPPNYALKARAKNYRAMAEWLNTHLQPGQPFLMESAYDLRWVSENGYFQTPGLIGAAPYVHGDMETLWEVQKDFLTRFPEAPFVEAQRHGEVYHATFPVWTWPHEHYRQMEEIWNWPMYRLVKRGMYPQSHPRSTPEVEYTTRIWYNTPDDLRMIARESGHPVVWFFEGWRTVQVGQRGPYAFYLHGKEQFRGFIRMEQVTDQPIRGQIRLQGGLAANAASMDHALLLDGQPIFQGRNETGIGLVIESGVLELAPGPHTLEWRAAARADTGFQALLLDRIDFIIEDDAPQDPSS